MNTIQELKRQRNQIEQDNTLFGFEKSFLLKDLDYQIEEIEKALIIGRAAQRIWAALCAQEVQK